MRIFDCHCHITKGFQNYQLISERKLVIFNEFDEYDHLSEKVQNSDLKAIIIDYKKNHERVRELITSKKVCALKIHNRIQKIKSDEIDVILEHVENLQSDLPIIYDAFYYGAELEFQPCLDHIIKIALKFPNVPIVVAHCGGHKVLEYFYHLRPLKNIYFDLSFSLAYLKTTSAFMDLVNLIHYTDKSKIMFGSDYPFSDPLTQYQIFQQISTELDLSDLEKDLILYQNANSIFKNSNGK